MAIPLDVSKAFDEIKAAAGGGSLSGALAKAEYSPEIGGKLTKVAEKYGPNYLSNFRATVAKAGPAASPHPPADAPAPVPTALWIAGGALALWGVYRYAR